MQTYVTHIPGKKDPSVQYSFWEGITTHLDGAMSYYFPTDKHNM